MCVCVCLEMSGHCTVRCGFGAGGWMDAAAAAAAGSPVVQGPVGVKVHEPAPCFYYRSALCLLCSNTRVVGGARFWRCPGCVGLWM